MTLEEPQLRKKALSAVLRYGLVLLAVGFSFLVRLQSGPTLVSELHPFVLLSVSIMLCTWFGGDGPGLLSVVFSAGAVEYFILPPFYSFDFSDRGANIQLVSFALEGLLIYGLTHAMRAARYRAEAMTFDLQHEISQRRCAEAALHLAHEDLEQRVDQRTAELRFVNAKLQRSEAQLAAAQEIAHLGSWEWFTGSGKFMGSDELYRIYDLEIWAGEITHEVLFSRLHTDDREEMHRALEKAFFDHQPFDLTHRFIRSDGTVKVIHAKGEVLQDAAGKALRIIGTSQDITEQKRAEAERARLGQEQTARAEAEAANRMKDEFLAIISHELRTPLTSIFGWLRMISTGRLDGTAYSRGMESIERNAKVLAHLIDDLLDVSRVINGKLFLEIQSVDLTQVVKAVVDAFLPAADAKQIRIEVKVDAGVGPIFGDPNRLQQIVWNLLANSMKFTPEGGAVGIRVDQAGSDARITVTDTGQGISADFLPHVFDRFRQADTSSIRCHGGLGLGLAIVHELVRLHRGSVRAESPGKGKGSTFIVRLPVKLARSRELESEDDLPKSGAA